MMSHQPAADPRRFKGVVRDTATFFEQAPISK
jgi:hypothetical protein